MAKTYLASKNRKPAGRVTANEPFVGTIQTVKNTINELVNTGEAIGSLNGFAEQWEKPYEGYFMPMIQVNNGEVTAGINRMQLKPGASQITTILLVHGYRVNKDGQSVDKSGNVVADEQAYLVQAFKGPDANKLIDLTNQVVPVTATMIAREGRAPIQSVDIDYSRLGKVDEDTKTYTHPTLKDADAATIQAFQSVVSKWKESKNGAEPSEAVLEVLAGQVM